MAGVRGALVADIAEAYLDAPNSRRALDFHAANLAAISALAAQAHLRFEAGEIPRSGIRKRRRYSLLPRPQLHRLTPMMKRRVGASSG